MFFGCGGGGLPGGEPSDAKAIVSVTILGTTATPSGTDIPVSVPAGTDVTALVPTIVHTGVSVSPDSGAARDFTEPVQYTVTAEDTSTQVYTVTVTAAVATSSEKDLTAFDIDGVSGAINGSDVLVTLPFGSDVTALVPTIVHTGVSVSPDSGVARDFTDPVQYTVVAEDGSTAVYTVTVTMAAAPNEMLSFRVGDLHATISLDLPAVPGSIVQPLPAGTNLSAVTPTLIHNGVSCTPASGETQDFSNGPVTYSVTGEDGAVQAYHVTIVDAGSVQAPRVAIVALGQTSSLGLRAVDPLGTPDPDATYAFTYSHPDIASVDASGEVTGLELGFTRIDIASPKHLGATTWVAVKELMDIAVGDSVNGDISASDGWDPSSLVTHCSRMTLSVPARG